MTSGKNKGKNFDETSNASMETADSLANEVDQNSVRSTGQELQDGPIYSYELVQEVEIDYTRPVVILGKDTNMYNLVYFNKIVLLILNRKLSNTFIFYA